MTAAPPPAAAGLKSIVVAGEFNAGKTSVINLLLRKEVQHASVDYSMMPPTEILPSADEGCSVVMLDGSAGDVAALRAGDIEGDELQSAEYTTDFGALTGARITEVSVGLNGRLDSRSRQLMESADLLIWCTMGQRAWALTEISVVEELPAKVLSNAILVMTRADYLRDEEKRTLVRKRLDTEARKFFPSIVQVSCGRAAVQASGSDDEWETHGGRALFDAVVASLVAGQSTTEETAAAHEETKPLATELTYLDAMTRRSLIDSVIAGAEQPTRLVLEGDGILMRIHGWIGKIYEAGVLLGEHEPQNFDFHGAAATPETARDFEAALRFVCETDVPVMLSILPVAAELAVDGGLRPGKLEELAATHVEVESPEASEARAGPVLVLVADTDAEKRAQATDAPPPRKPGKKRKRSTADATTSPDEGTPREAANN